MGYEIDFIGVKKELSKKDADAIIVRWKDGDNFKIAVYDGGFQCHGEEMVKHLNKYCFSSVSKKVIDCVIVSHPDQDHVSGLEIILNTFDVKALYMNRPWIYTKELISKKNDSRITEKSLEKRLRDKYPYIAKLEELAEKRNIPIHEAFQGKLIEKTFKILSPSKEFYLDLVVESDKTPLIDEKVEHNALFESVKFFSRYVKNLIEKWGKELLKENVNTSPENETSIVLLGSMPLDEEKEYILLTGDAGTQALNESISYARTQNIAINASVKFYQIPHHGGRNNVTPSLLNSLLGKIVDENCFDGRVAFVSSADGSDHPLQMVVNAFIRRGVKVYSNNNGSTICYLSSDMPQRDGWSKVQEIEFNSMVESWEEN